MNKIRSNEGVKQRFGIIIDATYVPIKVFKFPKGFDSAEDNPKTLTKQALLANEWTNSLASLKCAFG